ncbi:GTP-binding protein rho5 [Mycena rosella]|uniref:GTP-binding protein rho5 n=1 Tax=Mycena rosella TaxID=1033263 RepID=A0AAD7DNP8_MYCRO|nr:GTP-binding protein rho5 [Mycena rosella]
MSEFISRRKLVVVGDHACGKTCLLTVFAKGLDSFPQNFPTVFESWVVDIEIDGKCIALVLWDTATGTIEHARLRPLSYPDAHTVLICFAVDRTEALDDWIPEVLHFCSTLPILLVACKTDLRADPAMPEQKTLTPAEVRAFKLFPSVPPGADAAARQGEAFAQEINVYRYVECSTKSREGVKEVFEQAMHAVLPRWQDHGRPRRCIVL